MKRRHKNSFMLIAFFEKLMTTKVSLVLAIAVFGVVLALGVTIVVGAAGDRLHRPAPLQSSAAEFRRPPGYGYQNPRAVRAQGILRVNPGSTNVPAYIFHVYAPTGRDITTNHYQISFANERGLITKLSLVKNGVVLGTTVPENDYGYVTFTHPVTIAAGTYAEFQIIVDVVASVPAPPVYGYPAPPTFVVGVDAIKYADTRPSVMEGLPQNNLVLVATTEAGLLTGTLSVEGPFAQTVPVGATNINAARVNFTAGSGQDITLTRVSIGVTKNTPSSPVNNIRIYSDNNTLLATISTLNQPYGDIFLGVATLSPPLVVPRGATRTLRIVTDVQSKQEVVFRLGLVGLATSGPIWYTGTLPLYGSEITVTKSSSPNPPAPTCSNQISLSPLPPSATVGTVYSESAAAKPAGSYRYSVSSGQLPPGLTLYDYIGLVYGYPTKAGSYKFSIKAQTADGKSCGQATYRIVVK